MTKFSFSLEPNRVQFSPIGRTKRNRTDRYSIVILIATNHPLQEFQRRYYPRLQSGPVTLPTGRKKKKTQSFPSLVPNRVSSLQLEEPRDIANRYLIVIFIVTNDILQELQMQDDHPSAAT